MSDLDQENIFFLKSIEIDTYYHNLFYFKFSSCSIPIDNQYQYKGNT